MAEASTPPTLALTCDSYFPLLLNICSAYCICCICGSVAHKWEQRSTVLRGTRNTARFVSIISHCTSYHTARLAVAPSHGLPISWWLPNLSEDTPYVEADRCCHAVPHRTNTEWSQGSRSVQTTVHMPFPECRLLAPLELDER